MTQFTDPDAEIRRLEELIRKQDEYIELLDAAIDLSEVGFNISDANGIVLRINASQAKITGHDPGKTIGRRMSDIEAENSNSSATMQIVRTHQPITIEQVLPTGKTYLVYGQPYFGADGNLKYTVCNLIDNTQHNYVRQELKAAQSSNLELQETVQRLQDAVDLQKQLFYCSPKMKTVVDLCDKIAPFNSTVLILGESGVGKEVIANYIFQHSSRADKPFIKINCAAIPETLLESELFGYDSGAFTNASAGGKKGIFEIADNGTVLLDEIGDLPLHLQSKILRVLQEGEFYHIGGTQPHTTNVRIIASTNRDLTVMTQNGTFREDLFYRLSVIQITIPPLDERKDDIPVLINYFTSLFNEKYNLKKEFTFESIRYLQMQSYKGNIRELQNILERIMLLTRDDVIGITEIKEALDPGYYSAESWSAEAFHLSERNSASLKDLLSQYEKDLLMKYWNEYKCASRIAEALHTNQPTISRKLHAYGIIGNRQRDPE